MKEVYINRTLTPPERESNDPDDTTEEMIEWCRKNLLPEQVFSYHQLMQWAHSNNYLTIEEFLEWQRFNQHISLEDYCKSLNK